MLDAAIVGTGPAGVSAALNLKILNKNFIWLGSKNLSDKTEKAEKVFNYPGMPDITGGELNSAFKKHVDAMGIEITEHMVNSIMPCEGGFALMAGSEYYQAKCVILTTGVAAARTFPGESELLGRGVSYCATCDGMLYRNKVIAVVSNNPRFLTEVKYLAGIAEHVYFLPQFKLTEELPANVEVVTKRVTTIAGEKRVTGVEFSDGSSIEVRGIFILRDSLALSALMPGLATEEGHIAVNRKMETNIPGIFAAGDCTGRPYQFTKAVGEGNVAAHSAVEYLASI